MTYLKLLPIAIILISSYLLNIKSQEHSFQPIEKPTQDLALGYDYNNHHYNYYHAYSSSIATSNTIITITKKTKKHKTRKPKKVHNDYYYIITK